jgi:hypothetical protein
MNRIRIIGLALMAVFAFSAVSTSIASAELGPFYKVEGKTLKAGETRLLLASAKESFKLEVATLGQTITCTSIALEGGQDQIEGGLVGKSKEVIVFTGCTQTGNGTGCSVEGGKVTTVPVLNLLGYSNSNRTGLVLVLFEPEKGKVFTTVKYTGTCTLSSASVSGAVGALAQVGGNPVEVGTGTETLHGEVVFHKLAKTIWVEQAGGSLVETKAKLEFGSGAAATLAGTALLLVDLVLPNGERDPVVWGVFS